MFDTHCDVQDSVVDKNLTQLRSLGLKLETDGFVRATQDQDLPIRFYEAHIFKNKADHKLIKQLFI